MRADPVQTSDGHRSALDEALVRAVATSDCAGAVRALRQGANPNIATTGASRPILHLAAANGLTEICVSLARSGADLEARAGNQESETALHVAVKSRRHDVSRSLIEAGADINARLIGGGTSLHYAARNGDVAMVELLLGAGADANASGHSTAPPLFAATGILFDNEIEARSTICRLLVSAGANPNVSTSGGVSPLLDLILANPLRKGPCALAQVLVELGTDPCAISANAPHGAMSDMHTAAAAGNLRALRMFAEHGVDLNVRTPTGETIDELNDDPVVREALRSMRIEFAINRSLGGTKPTVARSQTNFEPL
jgi:ankyrin repeat protein